MGTIDLLRGFTIGLGNIATEISKIVKENISNIDSFNTLKDIQDAMEKQHKERNEMIQAISNPLKDIKIPITADIIKSKK